LRTTRNLGRHLGVVQSGSADGMILNPYYGDSTQDNLLNPFDAL
jgi:hypothetical protein